MGDLTPRFGLPLLAAGQAQKELFHNEAVTILEGLVQPVAETIGDNDPPAAPASGCGWIVGAAPTGEWTRHGGKLALWTDGGWRFVQPIEGICVWLRSASLWTRFVNGAWVTGVVAASTITIGNVQVVGSRQLAIATPAGGTVADAEARAATGAILDALRAHGLIAE